MEDPPKTRDGEKTRKIILDAAEKLFAERGFEGTTIRFIAKESGFSGPLILFHFQNKERLYQAVKKHIVTRYPRETSSAFSEHQSGKARVLSLLSEMFEFYRSNQSMVRLASWSLLEGDAEPWSSGSDALHHRYYTAVRKAQDAGEIRRDIPALSLLFIMGGAIHGWWEHHDHFMDVMKKENAPLIDDKAFLQHFLAFVTQGLEPGGKKKSL